MHRTSAATGAAVAATVGLVGCVVGGGGGSGRARAWRRGQPHQSQSSAGQRQLLAFARTLAHKPGVLVLDEATASVDTETELALQQAMGAARRARTTLVVAHRLSTIQDADRIHVMHHGAVAEAGTHPELLSAGGLYAKLWRLQALAGPIG